MISSPLSRQAMAEEGTCGETLTWSFSDGTLTLEGSGAMELPYREKWGDLDISKVKKVVLPDGLTEICDNAFQDFSNLAEVTLPTGLINIWSGAFMNCSSLVQINGLEEVMKNLEGLGKKAFENVPAFISYAKFLINAVLDLVVKKSYNT